MDVDMDDLMLKLGRIPVDQNTYTMAEGSWDIHLVAAHQGGLVPAQLARGDGRELRIEVSGRGKECTPDVFGLKIVCGNDRGQQLTRSRQNSLTGVRLNGCRTSDAATVNRHSLFLPDRERARSRLASRSLLTGVLRRVSWARSLW